MGVHLADSNRQGPGTGHINFLDCMRTLIKIGFDKYLSLDSVPVKPDWKTLLKSSITYMKEIEKIAVLQNRIDAELQGDVA